MGKKNEPASNAADTKSLKSISPSTAMLLMVRTSPQTKATARMKKLAATNEI